MVLYFFVMYVFLYSYVPNGTVPYVEDIHVFACVACWHERTGTANMNTSILRCVCVLARTGTANASMLRCLIDDDRSYCAQET